MNQNTIQAQPPALWNELVSKCKETGFTMPSDEHIGSLLRTLVSSRPSALVLELGTGIGLSLSWMVAGLYDDAKLITIDNDPKLIDIARDYFGSYKDVEIICTDGAEWIRNYQGPKFDLIFADAWPGKYSELDETLALIKTGGFYIIDDMLPQTNWPEGHEEKAKRLTEHLRDRPDLNMTQLDCGSGMIICTKL